MVDESKLLLLTLVHSDCLKYKASPSLLACYSSAGQGLVQLGLINSHCHKTALNPVYRKGVNGVLATVIFAARLKSFLLYVSTFSFLYRSSRIFSKQCFYYIMLY